MAKGTKELKRRITGVRNIQQITRAMEMVATQKLKRLQMRAEAVRPFSDKIQQLVARLVGSVRPDLSPLLQEREVRVTADLVVSADKGLCGAYNMNLVRLVQAEIPRGAGDKHRVRVLGTKGATLLRVRGIDMQGVYEDNVEKIDSTRARNIARELMAEFVAGHVDQVRVLHTAFHSATQQKPVAVTLLPIRPEALGAGGGAAAGPADVIIEPSADEVLRRLLPRSIEIRVYSAILESLAAEFTARRNAMKQATDAADEMISALRRQYNRARQESITKELLEVVSGAEALK